MSVDINVKIERKNNVKESGILTLLQEAKPAWDLDKVDIKVRKKNLYCF